jgi:hypothetical protein
VTEEPTPAGHEQPESPESAPPRRVRDPMWPVLVGVLIGVGVAAIRQPQAGLFLIAGSLAAGAFCRLVLTPRAAGSLVVRNRQVDVGVLAALAAAIAVLASVTPFPG